MAAQLTPKLTLLTSSFSPSSSFSLVKLTICNISIINNNSKTTITVSPTLTRRRLISNILIVHHNPFHAMESSLQLHDISLPSHLLHQTLIRLTSQKWRFLSSLTLSLPSHPSTIDVTSFNPIINIRQFDVVWQLILRIQTLNLEPQNSTFFILIRRLIAANFSCEAIRVFDDMPCFTENEVELNDFVYLIDTLCKYGYVRVAMEVFHKRNSGFRVCVKVFTVLTDGWYKMRLVDIGERLLTQMIDKGIEPNVVCYNSLLNWILGNRVCIRRIGFERAIHAAD